MSQPRISVVIATRNRAGMLKQSIDSVLHQSYRDFELIIVDDGSGDHTRRVVEDINDSRVVYLNTGVEQGAGISAARNLGALHSKGTWTAVHDDDDLMLPWRLEEQMRWANESVDFIFGAFVNFDDETGALQLHHGREMTYGAALRTGFAPGHSTWLVRTDLIRKFGYDEGLESAVDNNLAFRMLRSGVRFVHSGVICLLRRVHSGRITDTGGKGQKYAAKLNLQFLKTGVNSASQKKLWSRARRDWGPVDKNEWELRMMPFLPDHLVVRSGRIYSASNDTFGADCIVKSRDASSLNWEDFISLMSKGAYAGEVSTRLRESSEIEELVSRPSTSAEEFSDRVRVVSHFEKYCDSSANTRYLICIDGNLLDKFKGRSAQRYTFEEGITSIIACESLQEVADWSNSRRSKEYDWQVLTAEGLGKQ